MKPVLLIDFGSTYTKVTAVDVEKEVLLGTAASFTTIETDINEGLHRAIVKLEEQTGALSFDMTKACSSAAGGLRMMVSGLVPELTAQAAKMAALGAGAKIIKVYAHELTDEDIEEIDATKPDIFLLTGGTDGGNKDVIIHNANMLSTCQEVFPIVIAGNRSAAKACEEALAERETYRCENVMPTLNKTNIESVQKQIREIFLEQIIRAKGFTKAQSLLDGIVMPTPVAMLEAMILLSQGTPAEKGIGPLIGVDVGGATTDVYSIADGYPEEVSTQLKGLEEPFAKRTVEGDIGMRYSIYGMVEEVGYDGLAAISGLDEGVVSQIVQHFHDNKDALATTAEEKRVEDALAAVAVELALRRHVGTLESVYTPMGQSFFQYGKDLRAVETLILTGGALIHGGDVNLIAEHAQYSEKTPFSLKPRKLTPHVDKAYILSSMGVLSESYPDIALRIMKKELINE